jgi:hypothetical protein
MTRRCRVRHGHTARSIGFSSCTKVAASSMHSSAGLRSSAPEGLPRWHLYNTIHTCMYISFLISTSTARAVGCCVGREGA